MLSFWEKGWMTQFEYIIVGGGIVGLSTAISIKEKQPAAQIAVFDKGLLPSGASTKNAGFACFGSLTELLADLKSMEKDEVLSLVERRWEGLVKLRERLGDDQIDYKNYGGYELLNDANFSAIDQMENINDMLSPLFDKRIFADHSKKIPSFGFSPTTLRSMIYNSMEGQINTGKMMSALIQLAGERGINMFTGAEVKSFDTTNNAVEVEVLHQINKTPIKFKAQKLAVCNNAFARQLLPDIDVKPGRGQVLVTSPIDNLAFKGVFHMDEGYYYFRNFENRVLFGGGRNLDIEGETTYELTTTPLIIENLKKILQNDILPNHEFQIEEQWSGIMAFGKNKIPILKQVNDRIVVGVRLGGMGVAIGSHLGDQIATLITS